MLVTHSQETHHSPSVCSLESGIGASLKEVADASTSYALPVDVLSCMLSAHVQWANRTAEQQGETVPITYKFRDFDFDTFGVAEKILNCLYVTEKAINRAQDCLDYFDPFEAENISLNLAVAQGEQKPHNCETEARMRAVASVAAALGERDFVPFKVLFVEGW